MKKLSLLLILLLLIISCKEEDNTQVLVIPTIHGAHEVNKNYTYEDLLEIAKAYDPHVVGVEIRPEDISMGSDSLDIFYPLEMIMVRDSFPGKVSGIDYYSEDARNVKVSRQMFLDTTSETFRMKRLAQQMGKDTALLAQYQKTDIPQILEEQRKIALSYSAEDFLKGEYDSITGRQYQIEDSLFANTPYAAYTVFNNRRDAQITRNALQLVEQNAGKRVLILVGANHRNRLIDSLRKKDVVVVEDLGFMAD